MAQTTMMSYGEVYNTIVAAISNDYAGGDTQACRERNMPQVGAKLALLDSRPYHGDDRKFFQLARLYLGMLGDPNLTVAKVGGDTLRDWDTGYGVRATQDSLYVVWAREGCGLGVGDRIVAIDGRPLDAYRHGEHGRVLYGSVPEREDWDYFLRYAQELSVLCGGPDLAGSAAGPDTADPAASPAAGPAVDPAAGSAADPAAGPSVDSETGPAVDPEAQRGVVTVKPKRMPVAAHMSLEDEARPAVELYGVAPDVFCLRIRHFYDEDAIGRALAGHEGELGAARGLLVDLRTCSGGWLAEIGPLVPYLVDRPTTMADFLGEQGLYLRYSRNNCERLADIVRGMAGGVLEPGSEFEVEARRILSLAGAGFTWEDAEMPLGWRTDPVLPAAGPARVVVLSDVGCRGEGELLLHMASRQARPLTVGRASLGDTDYRDRVTVSFEDDIAFTYPVAATPAARRGEGVLGRGYPVQVEVPWTPAEVYRDLVLQKALELM